MIISRIRTDITIIITAALGIVPLAIAGLQTPSVLRAAELGSGDIFFSIVIFIAGVDLGYNFKKN